VTDTPAPDPRPGGPRPEAPWMAQARRAAASATARVLARCNELGIDWQDFYEAMVAGDKDDPPPRGMEDTFRRAFERLRADPGDCLRPQWAPPRPGGQAGGAGKG
jgi:hypothetical protein